MIHHNLIVKQAIALSVCFTSAMAVNIKFEPYLADVHNNSIVVCWRTNEPAGSFVEYGSEENDLDRTIGNSEPVVQHKVQVWGLEEDTKYYYRVKSGDYTSPTYYFTTHGPSKRNKFKFMEFSDTQNETGSLNPYGPHVSVVEAENPDLIISCGDQSQCSGFNENQGLPRLFSEWKSFLHYIPFYPIVGNHEFWNDAACTWETASARPSMEKHKEVWYQPPVEGGSDNWYYSFFYGGSRFVMTNSCFWQGTDFENCAPGQINWLKTCIGTTPHPYPFQVFLHHQQKQFWNASAVSNVGGVISGSKSDVVFEGHGHSWATNNDFGVQHLRPGRWDQFAVGVVDGNTMTITCKELPNRVLGTFTFQTRNPGAAAQFAYVEVTPALVTVNAGEQIQLEAVARDQYGDALADQPSFSWEVNGDAGSVDNDGLFTAGNEPGECVVLVKTSSRGGMAKIRVARDIDVVTVAAPKLVRALAPLRVHSASGAVSVSVGFQGEHTLVITDTAGRRFLTRQANGSVHYTLDEPTLPPGMYVASCVTKDMRASRHFVVTR